MEKDMHIALIGYKSHGQVPKEWRNYLDMLLTIYKEVHSEIVQGYIFTKKKDINSYRGGCHGEWSMREEKGLSKEGGD